jgi:hypothetical protein
MKKQIKRHIQPHLIRNAFYLLMAVAVCSIGVARAERNGMQLQATPTNASQRTLTFAERIACQYAIEDVYWRHRIWPEENLDPKPSLDAVMPQAQVETMLADYLLPIVAFGDVVRQ